MSNSIFRSSWHYVGFLGILIAASEVSAEVPGSIIAVPASILEARQKTCASLQQQLDQLLSNHAADSEVEAFRKRLQAADLAAVQVFQDLATFRDAFVQKSTANISRRSPQPTATKRTGSLLLLQRHLVSLEQLPAIQSADPATKALLTKYYDAYCQGTAQGMLSYGKSLITNSPADAAEVSKLSVILLCLTPSPDAQWNGDIENAMGVWLKNPEQTKAMEDLCLHAHRPHTAYWLATFTDGGGRPDNFSDYMDGAADRMLRAKDYPSAMICLRGALADTSADSPRWCERAFHVAEVLGDMNDNDGALEMLGTISMRKLSSDEFGKVAVLRLKYLFASQKFKEVMADATQYRDDPKTEKYLPQILYIGWVASQRLDGEDAEAWRKNFMEKFPDHPLGADMIFASAMQALASSKYDEAKRLLSYIEYKYPTAKIVAKATEIRKRLEQAASPTTKP